MSERLERVERFEELKPGVLFVYKACPVCGKDHRAMVLGSDGSCLDGLPQIHAEPRALCGACCYCACSVERGKVWRVLDGLGEPSTETAAASGTTRRTPQKETTDVR